MPGIEGDRRRGPESAARAGGIGGVIFVRERHTDGVGGVAGFVVEIFMGRREAADIKSSREKRVRGAPLAS